MSHQIGIGRRPKLPKLYFKRYFEYRFVVVYKDCNRFILALGQVMLYVDGMNGVIEDNPTIQWLYTLLTSRFRLVVKTALKLLLVFIEYVESNCLIFIQAVHAVHQSNGKNLVFFYMYRRMFYTWFDSLHRYSNVE